MSSHSTIRSLLFVAGEDGLKSSLFALEMPVNQMQTQSLEKLQAKYPNDRGFVMFVESSNTYKLMTKPDFLLRDYSKTPINQSLSRLKGSPL